MIVNSATRDYEVVFEESLDFLNSFGEMQNAFFVIDHNVFDLYKVYFENIPSNSLFIFDALEENKVIETALTICESMVEMNAKRNAYLISIGGGITQDVTGFAANILYRGIAWIFVPTTLLSACDSCIGGKTSLNYKHYKNLLGTFYPPNTIYVSPKFFRTLTEADLKSGLGEVVKFNVMGGLDTLSSLEDSLTDLLNLNPATVNEFVANSLNYKKEIIEDDEFDGGRRVLLNFAHTFAHAFEVSSEYAIPHGSAVALGLIAANSLSASRGLMNTDVQSRIEKLAGRIIPEFDPSLIDSTVCIGAIRKDKKQVGRQLTVVLLDEDLTLHVMNDVTEEEVCSACDYAASFLSEGAINV